MSDHGQRENLQILTLNAGASSLKCALFTTESHPARVFSGRIERIGQPRATLVTGHAEGHSEARPVDASDQRTAIATLLSHVASNSAWRRLAAVGHRIVHGGGRYAEPCVITAEVRAELQRMSPLDPEHLPFAIEIIDSVGRRWPDVLQVACFDTAFHQTLPKVAQMLPLPRRLFVAGVRRYGFHGLSYASLLDELGRTAGREAAQSRLVLAHLGNGASLAAVVAGQSVDTTMAFTPASGVPMGTRSGDLDPGIAGYLARTEGMSTERFTEMVNHESGLLGVSGLSADVRDVLAKAAVDARAAEAIDLFCYEIQKRIGALAAAMGGIDGLVFTGGVGENAAPIRTRVCDRLGFLGIHVDPSRNVTGAAVISPDGAPVTVRVIQADEERVIAEAVARLLDTQPRAQAGAR